MDVDRIALSRELSDLAQRFMREATLWKLPDAKQAWERMARHLAELSRVALTADDPDELKLAAYATAARTDANQIEGVRRLIENILHHPTVRKPE